VTGLTGGEAGLSVTGLTGGAAGLSVIGLTGRMDRSDWWGVG